MVIDLQDANILSLEVTEKQVNYMIKKVRALSNDKEIRAIEINSTDNKAKNLTSTNLSNDKGEVIELCPKCIAKHVLWLSEHGGIPI